MSLKNSSDTIGNRTRDLPACSAVPQPTAPPRSHWDRLTYVLPDKKVKVKCTLVQTLRLCTGRTAHRGSRVIALTLDDHGTRRG